MAVIEATKDDFKKLISEGKTLVKFYADWCGPCKMMAPVVEDFAEKHGEMKVVAVNIDNEDELAEKYEVSTIPCFVALKDGEETGRLTGVLPMKKLEKLMEG